MRGPGDPEYDEERISAARPGPRDKEEEIEEVKREVSEEKPYKIRK